MAHAHLYHGRDSAAPSYPPSHLLALLWLLTAITRFKTVLNYQQVTTLADILRGKKKSSKKVLKLIQAQNERSGDLIPSTHHLQRRKERGTPYFVQLTSSPGPSLCQCRNTDGSVRDLLQKALHLPNENSAISFQHMHW